MQKTLSRGDWASDKTTKRPLQNDQREWGSDDWKVEEISKRGGASGQKTKPKGNNILLTQNND